jgi:hypothetical protein
VTPNAVILTPNVVILDSIQDPCSNVKMDSGFCQNDRSNAVILDSIQDPNCKLKMDSGVRQNDGSASLSWS